MKEYPILFSGPMAKAILEGRKTQARRICKQGMPGLDDFAFAICRANQSGWIAWFGRTDPAIIAFTKKSYQHGFLCPYGQPGDQLWVRERHSLLATLSKSKYVLFSEGAQKFEDGEYFPGLKEYSPGAFDHIKWRPSIFMPRWASRIVLEIKDVRVEKLKEIKEEDALAEGMERKTYYGNKSDPRYTMPFAVETFAELWDSLNRKRGYGWDKGPWVWVIEFRINSPR